MDFYQNRRAVYEQELKKLTVRYNIISASRLLMAVSFLILGYYSLRANNPAILICCMAFCVVEFMLLMKRQVLVQDKRLRAKALIMINRQEQEYLTGTKIPFDDGLEFTDFSHSYSHDLDVFGPASVFHNLNRTKTFKGAQKLAGLLKKALPAEDILLNQEAVRELAAQPELRQEIMALGMVKKYTSDLYKRLTTWAAAGAGATSAVANGLAIAGPVVFTGTIAAYSITGNILYGDIAVWLFGFNLVFISLYLKAIKAEMKDITDIDAIIHHYGLILEQIEKANFQTEKLKALQAKLVAGNKKASQHIKKLAVLFSRLDNFNNVFGALLLNGTLLVHFHALKSLWMWKKAHSQNITLWLDVIAEAEALGSLGNLYYNNPDFTFPQLNSDYKIDFKNLAHPLIRKEKRIGNDISFNTGFMILTGSNMSGKSTFLRSLGINIVLAGAGAPVCASEAAIHPLPVLVSMRLSDSLTENESYFFAEVKRLKYIMDELQGKRAFVLLDEILKGTNSEDKYSGTVKVIKRMIGLQAIGAIATHNIEVCALTAEFPNQLANRCFEARIVNNELYFDYRLRDGICRNKSATFLMEKMGVI